MSLILLLIKSEMSLLSAKSCKYESCWSHLRWEWINYFSWISEADVLRAFSLLFVFFSHCSQWIVSLLWSIAKEADGKRHQNIASCLEGSANCTTKTVLLNKGFERSICSWRIKCLQTKWRKVLKQCCFTALSILKVQNALSNLLYLTILSFQWEPPHTITLSWPRL